MTSIINHDAAASSQLPATLPPRIVTGSDAKAAASSLRPALHGKGKSAEDVREAFTQFVGEAFYGQMIKAMRTTVGKPAYFNGGRGEEVFQGQLDQQLAQHLTETSASKFSEPLFERQFPHLAKHLAQPRDRQTFEELSGLRPR